MTGVREYGETIGDQVVSGVREYGETISDQVVTGVSRTVLTVASHCGHIRTFKCGLCVYSQPHIFYILHFYTGSIYIYLLLIKQQQNKR